MPAHPFIALLRERTTRTLWAGVSLSAVGDELYRIGVIWLAIGIVGADASYIPTAQYAAILAVSVLAETFAERLSPRSTLIATGVARALFAIVPVLLWATVGLTFATLLTSAVAFASFRALFDPALLSSVPRLATKTGQLQATNALFDATLCLARFVGPSLAGGISLVVPTIHLLTLTTASQLSSVVAVFRIGPALDAAGPTGAARPSSSFWRGLGRGYAMAWRAPFVRYVLAAHGLILATWMLGLTLGTPMLIARQPPAGFEARPLAALGLILSMYGAGDVISNLMLAGYTPKARARFMFSGYLVLGVGLTALPVPLLLPWGRAQLPAMMTMAFVGGLGSPMFFLLMMTTLQSLYEGADLRSLLRLRLALTSLAMMAGAAAGPFLFDRAGPAVTVMACGGVTIAVGLTGVLVASFVGRPGSPAR